LLNALLDIYARTEHARTRSIKGYVQLAKIAVFVFGAIIIVSIIIDRSPLLLLSGLGAMSAVLLLVYKDTLMSFVASVQLTSNDMLRVGDWIEMPQVGADGDVVDITLYTVKVQNFDKTIVSVPTWRLMSESFKNWRGMQQSGGRRIKRAIYVDS
ncbi:mechanosensitive ion channel family protein, partial [Pseudomonas aeruginosa]